MPYLNGCVKVRGVTPLAMKFMEWEKEIDALVADPAGVRGKAGKVVDKVIAALDEGRLRVCEPFDGGWITHAWIKRAILLYFARLESVIVGTPGASRDKSAEDLRDVVPSYYDKIPTKRNYEELGVRCVPPGVARYGSFLAKGVILMPSYVNIGAYVDEGSMVDTWATVGSCAQIGKGVHLSGGVGIGGVLEPAQAQPVVIEDGAFIGSRCIVVEGVRVGAEAVLGAGVVLTASTPERYRRNFPQATSACLAPSSSGRARKTPIAKPRSPPRCAISRLWYEPQVAGNPTVGHSRACGKEKTGFDRPWTWRTDPQTAAAFLRGCNALGRRERHEIYRKRRRSCHTRAHRRAFQLSGDGKGE